jgi:UDPglucose--hexose-1-phosphate uridylyltransferase
MSELRLDPTTREWVVIATERARRPHDFASLGERPPVPEFSATCPFCPGNEDRTTTERAVYNDPDTGRWQVRVIDNKYPAVNRDGGVNRRQEHPLALALDGVGAHEVVVESPLHNRYFGLMSDREALSVVRAYRDRLVDLSAIPTVRQVIIFKNHGPSAGTSLEHPHSQIVATPVVPWHRRHHYEVAVRHFDEYGRNLYQDLVDFELQQETRVVRQTPFFVEIHPYASRRPFETWVVPRSPRSSLAAVPDEELLEFARVMRDALRRIHTGLNDPDYNHVVYTAPAGDECEPYYSWHLRIYPRLTAVAGFEIGSGIHINTSLPENTADYMRGIDVSEPRAEGKGT